MADRYGFARRRVARKIGQWNTGAVTLTRTTTGAPDEATPWIPGEPTEEIYTLDAVVSDVAAEYRDDTLVTASHLMVVASPRARNAEGETVDLVPTLADVIEIDGKAKEIIRIVPAPAAGAAAVFNIFVAA